MKLNQDILEQMVSWQISTIDMQYKRCCSVFVVRWLLFFEQWSLIQPGFLSGFCWLPMPNVCEQLQLTKYVQRHRRLLHRETFVAAGFASRGAVSRCVSDSQLLDRFSRWLQLSDELVTGTISEIFACPYLCELQKIKIPSTCS